MAKDTFSLPIFLVSVFVTLHLRRNEQQPAGWLAGIFLNESYSYVEYSTYVPTYCLGMQLYVRMYTVNRFDLNLTHAYLEVCTRTYMTPRM